VEEAGGEGGARRGRGGREPGAGREREALGRAEEGRRVMGGNGRGLAGANVDRWAQEEADGVLELADAALDRSEDVPERRALRSELSLLRTTSLTYLDAASGLDELIALEPTLEGQPCLSLEGCLLYTSDAADDLPRCAPCWRPPLTDHNEEQTGQS